MSTALPEALVAYKRTPVFDEDSLPAGLRKDHHTREGTWALIHVLEGQVRYRIYDPPSEEILSAGHPGVVRPQERHCVEPLGPFRMYVEFYASPTG